MPMIGDWTSKNPRDVSLYFHIPFCSKKCPYCHFFVLPDKTSFKEQFLASIALEWQLRLPQLAGKKIVSIYFGGGTPSRLSPEQLATLLTPILTSGLEIDPLCEITLEANPEDVTTALLSSYRRIGINRLSLGIQSLNDAQLNILDRQHSAQKGIDAIILAEQAGFKNISIDLMYDIPHQDLSSWQSTLRSLNQLPITHLSLYNLTFEPHTVFFKRKQELTPHLPTDEQSLKLLQEAINAIESIGLNRYEISAFARPGMHSRHNTGYWTGRPFLGLGPSAFSYWEGKRFRNIAHLNRYTTSLNEYHTPSQTWNLDRVKAPGFNDRPTLAIVESQELSRGSKPKFETECGITFPIDFEESLAYPHNLAELFAIRLRLKEGIDLALFEQSHGAIPHEFHQRLEDLVQKGWLHGKMKESVDGRSERNVYSLTQEGMLFYDSVATELIYTQTT